jgi:hypothetical protein
MAARLETCPRGEEKTNHFACIFLQHFPSSVCCWPKLTSSTPKTLATQADKLWALHDNNKGGGSISAVQENLEVNFVTAISGDRRREGGTAEGKPAAAGKAKAGSRLPGCPSHRLQGRPGWQPVSASSTVRPLAAGRETTAGGNYMLSSPAIYCTTPHPRHLRPPIPGGHRCLIQHLPSPIIGS